MSQTLKLRISGWGVLVGSLALLALTAVMNWMQGANDGVTGPGMIINGVGSVAIDIMGLLFCGLAAGICFATKRWGWGFIFGAGLVCSAVWSGYSVYSFRASEEISASTTRELANKRIAVADSLAAESVRKSLDNAKGAETRSARRDFIAANRDAIKDFRNQDVQVVITPTAGSKVVADRLGMELATIQIIRSAFFSFLVIFLKMIGFPGAGFLLSWSPEPTEPERKPGNPDTGSGTKSTEETKDKEPAREAEIHRFPSKVTAAPDQFQTTPKVSSGPPRVPAPAPHPSLQPEFSSVSDFLAMHPSVTNQKVIADALGVSQAKVSRDIKKLKGQGKVKVKKNWRSNAVTFTPRRNGGLHAVI
jgi:hypothetical protein